MNKNTFGLFTNVIITASFLLTPLLSSAQVTGSITEDLYLGLQNSQVLLLQQILQQLGDFPASTQPTGYFGPITENAVKKFQERAVINPATGQFYNPGTGYVGPLTRAALTIAQTTSKSAGFSTTNNALRPTIASIDTPYADGVGVIVSDKEAFIHGTGLAGFVTVKIKVMNNAAESIGVVAESDTMASFIAPSQIGSASVSVVGANGVESKSSQVYVSSATFLSQTPVISSRSPSPVAPGGKVALLGKYFEPGAVVILDDNSSITPYFIERTKLGFVVPQTTSVGAHTIKVSQDGGNRSSTASILGVEGTLTPEPLSLTQTSLGIAKVGLLYSEEIGIVGGIPPHVASVTVGTLPAGLKLNNPVCSDVSCSKGTMEISGRPTTAGDYYFTIAVTSGTQTVSWPFKLVVSGGYVPPTTGTTTDPVVKPPAGTRILSRDYIGTTDIPCMYGTTLIGPCMYEGQLMSVGYPPPDPDPSGYIEMNINDVPYYPGTNHRPLYLGGGKKYALKFKGDTIVPSFPISFGGGTVGALMVPLEMFGGISRTKGDFYDVPPGCLFTPAGLGSPGAGGVEHGAATINVVWKGGPYDWGEAYANRGGLCILEPNGYYYLNVAGTCSAYWDPPPLYPGWANDCPTVLANSTGANGWMKYLDPNYVAP